MKPGNFIPMNKGEKEAFPKEWDYRKNNLFGNKIFYEPNHNNKVIHMVMYLP